MSLVFVDVETTGLDPARHQVWEMAYALEGDDGVYSSIVRHDLTGADPTSLAMNGYWDRGRRLRFECDQFAFEAEMIKALEGNTLVAANPAFDSSFLKARWGRAPWKYRMIDIESYAMPLLGLDEPVGLAKIADELGVDRPDHSAGKDVEVLRKCFYLTQDFYDQDLGD